MTDFEASDILAWMQALWPKVKLPDALQTEWVKALKVWPQDVIRRAIVLHLRGSNWAPTLGAILGKARAISPSPQARSSTWRYSGVWVICVADGNAVNAGAVHAVLVKDGEDHETVMQRAGTIQASVADLYGGEWQVHRDLSVEMMVGRCQALTRESPRGKAAQVRRGNLRFDKLGKRAGKAV